MPKILAIESSCDDTSAAALSNGNILCNVVSGQSVHDQYGGVVPELASRAHQQNILPVVKQTLYHANLRKAELDAIAFTQGPGLLGALLVASSFAKGLSLSLNIPLIGVNHLHAHLLSHFIKSPQPNFPFLVLLISGGHTQLFKVNDFLEYEIIGKTIDDAAGEAMDKAAKILGLPYPGGPYIDQHAKNGDPYAFDFPLPKLKGLNFSFSGLKTALLYFIRDRLKANENFIQENMPDICAAYQNTIVQYLLKQLKRASEQTGIQEIGIAGGVAANSKLRDGLSKMANQNNWNVYIPDFQYCTDNAGMIGLAAYHKYQAGLISDLEAVSFTRGAEIMDV